MNTMGKLLKGHHGTPSMLGAAFLIAGTTIGVGMFALPIVTGPAGFLPSMLLYFACWAFMLFTGLLTLEVCSWMPEDSNYITMATKLLGTPGKVACWLIYLFFFEMLLISHMVGGGGVTQEIFQGKLGFVPAVLIYVVLFSPVVYLGAKMVDRLNVLMFAGVLLAYLLFVIVSVKHVDVSKLTYSKWGKIWGAVPILFSAFGYQAIIPTLTTYMKKDFRKMKQAIILGTSIPLGVYLIWQFLILGIIPIEGPNGFLEAARLGQNAVMPLKHFVGSGIVVKIGSAFAFFTMTASYIAISLAFLDFLADGLKVKKVGLNKILLCIAIFIPPLLITFVNPNIFLKALGYVGGICCAVLFGMYPPLMAWVGRYRKYKTHPMPGRLGGGKILLAFLILLMVLELGLEVIPQLLHAG